MVNLVRARSWGSVKPPPGTPIERGHPLADGIVIAIPANEGAGRPRDLARAAWPTEPSVSAGVGPMLWGNTQRGVGALFRSGFTTHLHIGDEGANLRLPTASCTVMLGKWRSSGPPRDSTAFGVVPSASVNRLGAHLPYSDGVAYWDFGGLSSPNRISVGGLTYGDDIWALTAGYRGSTIWQNGVLRASQSSAITRTADSSSFHLNLGNSVATTEDETRYSFFYLWNRELTGAEIQWLTAEPYAFFAPPGPKALYLDLAPPPAATFRPQAVMVS